MTEQNIKFFVDNTKNRNIVWRPFLPEEFDQYDFDFVTAQHFEPSKSYTSSFENRTFFFIWYNARDFERKNLVVELALKELVGSELVNFEFEQFDLHQLLNVM